MPELPPDTGCSPHVALVEYTQISSSSSHGWQWGGGQAQSRPYSQTRPARAGSQATPVGSIFSGQVSGRGDGDGGTGGGMGGDKGPAETSAPVARGRAPRRGASQLSLCGHSGYLCTARRFRYRRRTLGDVHGAPVVILFTQGGKGMQVCSLPRRAGLQLDRPSCRFHGEGSAAHVRFGDAVAVFATASPLLYS